jgi:hypothetical protein
MPISSLYRPLLVVLGVTAGAAIMAGWGGFALSERSILVLTELRPDAWVELLPRSEQNRFMAVWFAHSASYLFGFVGGGILILSDLGPQTATAAPHHSPPNQDRGRASSFGCGSPRRDRLAEVYQDGTLT